MQYSDILKWEYLMEKIGSKCDKTIEFKPACMYASNPTYNRNISTENINFTPHMIVEN